MSLNLKKRDNPAFTFTRNLPEYLAGDKPCHITFEMRAAGTINPEYMAAIEALTMRAQVMDRKLEKVTDDGDAVKAQRDNLKAISEARFAAVYDTCVINWTSNILNDDKPLEATRSNFIALLGEKVPALSQALVELEKEAIAAGSALLEADKATVKN